MCNALDITTDPFGSRRNPMTKAQRVAWAALTASALMGLHGSASATPTTVHASLCVSQYYMPASAMVWGINGVVNVSSDHWFLTCPLPRASDVSVAGMQVSVNGFVPTASEIQCTVSTVTKGGVEIGRSPPHFTGPGKFQMTQHLSQAQVPLQSTQSVRCRMPPQSQLFNITVNL